MSCNSADLHSCAFQDRLWMNEWRECWTDANFSGSARIEDRRVGRGGRQHLMLLRRFTLLFSPTLSTAETLSVLFALSSLASPLCRSPHSLLCASCHILPGSNASTGRTAPKKQKPSWVLIWCFKVISFSCFRSRKILNQQQSFKAHCLYLIQAGTSHWDLKRLLFLLLCFNMCLIFMSCGFISFCCHRRGVEEPANSKTKVMPKNSCWRTHFTFYWDVNFLTPGREKGTAAGCGCIRFVPLMGQPVRLVIL